MGGLESIRRQQRAGQIDLRFGTGVWSGTCHGSMRCLKTSGTRSSPMYLQNLFALDDITDIPNREVYVIFKPDGGHSGQTFFNNLVSEIANEHWRVGNRISVWRDPPFFDDPIVGARLRIDGTRQVY